MATTKQVREAKAALDALLAKRAELKAQIDAAEKPQRDAAARTAAVQKRRRKVRIVSNTGGNRWVGTLAEFSPEHYGLQALVKASKASKFKGELATALENGEAKVVGRGGIGLTLRGLSGRVRIPDPAQLRAYERAVKARELAEKRARDARAGEANALLAVFDGGAKIATADLLASLLDIGEANARELRLRESIDYTVRQQFREINDDTDWSPVGIARLHLKHLQSGSAEPCPCRNCAHDRQEAIKLRDLNTRLDTLPTVMHQCAVAGHGRHRMTTDVGQLRAALDAENRQRWLALCQKENLTHVIAWLDSAASRAYDLTLPRVWCRKTNPPTPAIDLTAFNTQLAKEAKAASKIKPITFVCPNPECEETVTDEHPANGMVECGVCGAEWSIDAIKIAKAA